MMLECDFEVRQNHMFFEMGVYPFDTVADNKNGKNFRIQPENEKKIRKLYLIHKKEHFSALPLGY